VGLNPGTYNIEEVQPYNYYSTGSNGGYGGYDTNGDPVHNIVIDGIGSVESGNYEDANAIVRIILGDGDLSIENNFGEKGGLVGDQVFYDADKNGVYEVDGEDKSLVGIEVTLYEDINQNCELDEGDKPMRSTVTNEYGLYYFSDLPTDDPGGDHDFDYIIAVTDQREVIVDAENTRGDYGVNNHSQDALGYWTAIDADRPENLTADFGFWHGSMVVPAEEEGDLSDTGSNLFILMIVPMIFVSSVVFVKSKEE